MPRFFTALLFALGLAGCTATPKAQDVPVLRERQERACAAATADHIGRGLDAVSPTWKGVTEGGGAEVEVRDGDRLHVCEVDANAQPLRLLHLQA